MSSACRNAFPAEQSRRKAREQSAISLRALKGQVVALVHEVPDPDDRARSLALDAPLGPDAAVRNEAAAGVTDRWRMTYPFSPPAQPRKRGSRRRECPRSRPERSSSATTTAGTRHSPETFVPASVPS